MLTWITDGGCLENCAEKICEAGSRLSRGEETWLYFPLQGPGVASHTCSVFDSPALAATESTVFFPTSPLVFILFKKYLFIWLIQVLVAARRIFVASVWDLFVLACILSSCGSCAQLLCSMRDLSSPTRDRTHTPYIAGQILNHWTTREVPFPLLLDVSKYAEEIFFLFTVWALASEITPRRLLAQRSDFTI